MKFKDFMSGVGIFVGVVLVIFILAFVGNAIGLFNLNFWGTKYQNAQYHIFKNSQPYQQGMAQDLQNMRLKYLDPRSTEEQKEAIRATVQQRFGGYDPRELPPDLQGFYYAMMNGGK